ncbi:MULTISPECIES: hypothetical protein [unclassified Paenibacillus]|uniref:hypothetical protein n=1 Tax=unclassified Paenibacillus TaxID=185978 RepID=UPI0027847E6F|nr:MULTISPECIES: hypothetical protein [unclassified Paenibacillus]MDQ0896434.1 hypothetical protein [Paenibacillus sp. V4I7]MDQ0914022.1 hypothetical protein [Paenibacillus sp. V4I5]
MKYKIGAILCVIFLALILGLALFQDGQKRKQNTVEFPTIEDVISAEIDIGGPPGPNKEPIQMDLNNNMQKITVAKITYWLSHAEFVSSARNQSVSFGGGPNQFVMKTRDGKSIGIVDAFDSISIEVPNGWMATEVSVSDQVTISFENKVFRLRSPDLKRWIETDMNKIINDRLKEPQKQ